LEVMAAVAKPNLDDLCAAMARFLHCLERADRATLLELRERVIAKPHPKRVRQEHLAGLIQAEIDDRRPVRIWPPT
jgi:hypothetical protein